MKNRLRAFFAGRYGFDELGRVLLWSALVMLVASSFIGIGWLRTALYAAALCLLGWGYARAFSRNAERCEAQNRRYLAWWDYQKLRIRQRTTHRFYRCPACGQRLRVPKGKGKISITCGKCGERMIKTT